MIRDSNGIIKVARNRHSSNASIINVECMAFREGVHTTKYYSFSNLENEGDSKIIINCYNKNSYSPTSII